MNDRFRCTWLVAPSGRLDVSGNGRGVPYSN
jgi:hypothetical protein